MPALEESCSGAAGAGDDGSDKQRRCSCLPFSFWGAPSGGVSNSPVKRRRRRRRLRLSWLAWPWSFFSRKGGGENKGAGGGEGLKKGKKTKKRTGRRLLVLLTASLQPKKALESVVSGDGALLPAKVSSFGDAKKKSNRKPRPTTADDPPPPSGTRQLQASTTAATASTRWASTATAHALSRPETSPPSPGPVATGRIWRAPSRRPTFHRQPESADRPGGGLWTAATTLGVIVLFGRVTAVVFLCSCLYGARFVRVRLGGAGTSAGGRRAKAKAAKSSGVAGGSIGDGRRFGDQVGVAAEKVEVAAGGVARQGRQDALVALW